MAEMFLSCSTADFSVGHFDMGLVTTAANMFYSSSGSILTTSEYDAILIAWAAQSPDLKPAVPFGVSGAKYSAGAATSARAVLTGTHTWTITDGGPAAVLVNDYMQDAGVSIGTHTPDVDAQGSGWQLITGSAAVGAGQCLVGGGGGTAIINSGSADVVITATVYADVGIGVPADTSIIFRSRVAGTRYMEARLTTAGNVELWEVDLVSTLIASAAVPPPPVPGVDEVAVNEHHLQVWVSPTSLIQVYVDGVERINVTHTFQMARIRHGLRGSAGAIYLREIAIAEYPV
jgi:hypothetical protein